MAVTQIPELICRECGSDLWNGIPGQPDLVECYGCGYVESTNEPSTGEVEEDETPEVEELDGE